MPVTTSVLPTSGEYVELAATSKGKLFRKRLLRIGESFVHPSSPGKKVDVTDEFADQLVRNFDGGFCDTVQFPMVDEKNRHVEDPSRNLGQVVGLTKEDDGVYATIDVRKNADDIGTTVLGCSAMMSLNHVDTLSGDKVGPVLYHVAATNRPYLSNLGPYEAVSLSATDDDDYELLTLDDGSHEPDEKGDIAMAKKEDLIAALKNEHGIDVAALQSAAPQQPEGEVLTPAAMAALSGVLKAADPDMVSLSAADEDDLTIQDIADGIVELSSNHATVVDRLAEIEGEQAAARVDSLVSEGKILPSQKDAMLELCQTNPDMFEKLIPGESVVELTERGVTSHERTFEVDDAASEVERLMKDSQV